MVQKSKGFTLIETIVITAVTVLLLLIGTIYLKGYQENFELISARRQVRSVINGASREAIINHEARRIEFSSKSHQLFVKRSISREPLVDNFTKKKITVGKNIMIYNLDQMVVSPTGSISPRTIVIKNKKKTLRVKVQMMWGKMIDE